MEECRLCGQRSLLIRGARMAVHALGLKNTKYLMLQKDGTFKEKKDEELETEKISIAEENEVGK